VLTYDDAFEVTHKYEW